MDNWKSDIAFGGSKYLFKVVVADFGAIMIQYVEYNFLEKKVVEKYFETDYENYIQRLFNLSILKKDKYYDMNNRQTIEQLKLHKKKAVLDNIDLLARENKIDINTDYVESVLKTTNKQARLNMVFCNLIFNNVIAVNYIENEKQIFSDKYMTYFFYKIYCHRVTPFKSYDGVTIKTATFTNNFEKEFVVDVMDTIDNNYEEPSTDYEERYTLLLNKLEEITHSEMQSMFFDSGMYQVFLDTSINQNINEYYSNINGISKSFDNLGTYLQTNCCSGLKMICYNDTKYNKLFSY